MSQTDLTRLLKSWKDGDQAALDQLLPAVYEELNRLAARYLGRERRGHTLQPTALVHEAYLRMIDQRQASWENRAHFFGMAANLMRRILIDHARRRRADKRGGQAVRVTLDQDRIAGRDDQIDLLELDSVLVKLAELAPRECRIVEMRFFGGLSVEETAVALGISAATVKRDWNMARSWLFRELSSSND